MGNCLLRFLSHADKDAQEERFRGCRKSLADCNFSSGLYMQGEKVAYIQFSVKYSVSKV